MKKIKFVLSLFLPVLMILSACNGQGGYSLKGTINNAANLQATLEKANFDRSTGAIGRTTCDANGNFTIESKEPWEEGIYTLSIGAQKMFFMLNGKEHEVTVKGDLSTISKLQVEFTGSETATCYANIVQELFKSTPATPELGKAFIDEKCCNALMKAFFTSQMFGRNAGPHLDAFKKAAKNLNDYMPGSKYAADYDGVVANLEKQVLALQNGQAVNGGGGIQVGQQAPDISLPGPDGKVRSLSSLKGKVVLLDFWASWCGPCRRENPHVVEVYKKYNAKGFEVFSVSLDGADPRMGGDADQLKQKEADGKKKWVAAIQQDGLIWDNHVSDLKHWGSAPAAVYGVRAIPNTFLIDRSGKIVALNPRQNLEEELLKVL